MAKDCRQMFESTLEKDGQTQKLADFREAVGKLSGDWIAMQLFAFDALCNYKGIPNNNGTPEWSTYAVTGSIEEWKQAREQRLKKEAHKV